MCMHGNWRQVLSSCCALAHLPTHSTKQPQEPAIVKTSTQGPTRTHLGHAHARIDRHRGSR